MLLRMGTQLGTTTKRCCIRVTRDQQMTKEGRNWMSTHCLRIKRMLRGHALVHFRPAVTMRPLADYSIHHHCRCTKLEWETRGREEEVPWCLCDTMAAKVAAKPFTCSTYLGMPSVFALLDHSVAILSGIRGWQCRCFRFLHLSAGAGILDTCPRR